MRETLSYEDFARYINLVKENFGEIDKIAMALKWDGIYDLSMSDKVIDLLGHILNDEDEWIKYWVYEADFGRAWEDILRKRENRVAMGGKWVGIDLSTTRKLYDFLTEGLCLKV